MFEIGRLCIKIAGRDAGLKCVVVEEIDDLFVLVDGQTRRRKCNKKHLEPLKELIKIKKGAAHTEVVSEFKKLKLDIKETKAKKATVRPRKVKKQKVVPVKGTPLAKAKLESEPEVVEEVSVPKKEESSKVKVSEKKPVEKKQVKTQPKAKKEDKKKD